MRSGALGRSAWRQGMASSRVPSAGSPVFNVFLETTKVKKNLIALAALAFVGAASAQTSTGNVTLWGVVDADISHYSLGGLSKTMASSSGGNAGSQLGFRGTEDLGGGMSANFWLETQLSNQTGGAGGLASNGGTLSTSFFNRRSTVSLAGSFGEVRLGRDYTPSFFNHFIFDPFRDAGPGAGTNITLGGPNLLAGGGANALTAVRASNALPIFWGFQPNGLAVVGSGVFAQVMYAFAGNANGQPAVGEYAGGRVGYANGPVNVALSYAESKGLPYAADAAQGYSTYKESNLGGWYDFGVATVMAHYGVNNSDAAPTSGRWVTCTTCPNGLRCMRPCPTSATRTTVFTTSTAATVAAIPASPRPLPRTPAALRRAAAAPATTSVSGPSSDGRRREPANDGIFEPRRGDEIGRAHV